MRCAACPASGTGRNDRRSDELSRIARRGAHRAARSAIAEIPLAERKSGYDFMGRETRAMQDDDTANPGMLWVLDGEALWKRKAGAADKSCADCHGDAHDQHEGRRRALSGVQRRARPAGQSRAADQHLPHRPAAGDAVRLSRARTCSRSRPMSAGNRAACRSTSPTTNARKPFLADRPRRCSTQRQGQLNLSCAQCHDDNWGQKLAGSPIPQGQPTGYPLYRLEWQNARLAAAAAAQLPDRHARRVVPASARRN